MSCDERSAATNSNDAHALLLYLASHSPCELRMSAVKRTVHASILFSVYKAAIIELTTEKGGCFERITCTSGQATRRRPDR